MTSIKTIVFDFDNCIAFDEQTREGSEEVKDRAWFEVFSEYAPGELTPVVEQAKQDVAGGTGDRRDIVERVLVHFGFPKHEIPGEIIRRCDKFNRIVQEGIARMVISPNVTASLEKLSKRFSLYVNTATPHESAVEGVRALGIEKFFKGMYGRPGTKADNLRALLAREDARPDEVLMVDDQQSGWRVAQEIGCRFVGMSTARNTAWHEGSEQFPIINSLADLLEMLSR